MNYISQIQLGSKGYLDISQDVSIPLNLSVAEIQDISKRQGGYSKTIVLPSTSNNDNLFGHLFDVNIVDGTFDLNKKEKCLILQNGVPVFDGYLQLLNVTKTSPAMPNGDEQISYEVQVKDTSGDFFSSMQDKYLEDLSGFDQYDHIYTLSAITATSGNTWEDVYKYHMNYNQTQSYKLTDFTPSIFAKAYLDRIFLDAGYSYQWPSLEENLFDKMVIPFNGDSPKPNLDKYGMRAGMDGIYQEHIFSSATDTNIIIFNDDTTLPNIDSGNTYSTITGKWTSGYYGSVSAKVAYTYEVLMYAPVNCYLESGTYYDGNFALYYATEMAIRNLVATKMYVDDTFEIPLSNSLFYDNYDYLVPSGTTGYASPTPNTLNFSAGYTSVLNYGITPEFNGVANIATNQYIISRNQAASLTVGNNTVWKDASTNLPLPTPLIPRIVVRIGINDNPDFNYFKVTPSASLNEGMTINLQDFIPKKIKQKDFLSGLVKMFNIYITPSKDNDKTLIFETRDEFYDNGSVKDWTSKFVVDQDTKIQFLPDLQNKIIRLSYKPDNDIFNTTYLTATGENYGQVDYTFENEFVQGIKLIETIFSPSPLTNNGTGNIVSAINSNYPKNNIRILFDGGWIPCNSLSSSTWTYLSQVATGGFAIFDKYPYAGHLYPNPIQPTDDLNFAQPDYLFYDTWDNVTDNNLYNKYWKRFINQIETGRLMTAKFKLTESDILNINFRDKIWIHDTYWFLNKIVDYNANSNNLTTVELISVDEGVKFNPSFPTKAENPIINDGPRNNWVKNQASLDTVSYSNLFGDSTNLVSVYGVGNVIQSGTKQNIIIGDNNNLGGKYGLVVGNDNTIQGNGVIALGVSGQTLLDSNVITLGLPVVATTISAQTLDLGGQIISGGTQVFSTGSTGVYSVKQITDTSTDATGDYAYAEGKNTTASGAACHAQGINTIAGGFASHAGGLETATNMDGEFASSCTSIGSPGQTQFGIIDGFTSTVDATPSLLDFFINGSPANGWRPSFAAAGGTVFSSFRYQIVCSKFSTNEARIITGEGLIKWIGGTPTLSFASTPSVNGDIALLGVTATAVVSGNGLQFQVTGLAATSLIWRARVDYNF